MEKFSSYLTKKAEVRKSNIEGKGVFAKKKIKKGEIISIWGGDIVTEKEYDLLSKKNRRYGRYGAKILDGFYLATHNIKEKREPTDFFNHSCDPNAGIKGQIILVAMRDIKSGEEITFDYGMNSDDSDDYFQCNCGSKNCRKIITGQDWKIPKLQKKYKGYFSWHIQEKIQKLKKRT